MSLALSSSAFLIQSSLLASATTLPNSASLPDTSGASNSDAFAEVFARTQAASFATADLQAANSPKPAELPLPQPDWRADDRALPADVAPRPEQAPQGTAEAGAQTAADDQIAAPAPKQATDAPAAESPARDDRRAERSDARQAHQRGKLRADKDDAGKVADQAGGKDETDAAGQAGSPEGATPATSPTVSVAKAGADGAAKGDETQAKPADGAAATVAPDAALLALVPQIAAPPPAAPIAPNGAAKAGGIGGANIIDSGKSSTAGAGGDTTASAFFLALALRAQGGASSPATAKPADTNAAGGDASARIDAAPGTAAPAVPAATTSLAQALAGLKTSPSEGTASPQAAEGGIKALASVLKAGASTLDPQSQILLPQALSALNADSPQAANGTAAKAAETLTTTLAALPVAIGSRAINGAREFTIHLYPAELGKVEVKLSIGDAGDIRAILKVDRVETLQLLQRDAHTLHTALEQAGFKPGTNGVEVSLNQNSQQNFSQRQTFDQGSQGGAWSKAGSDTDEPQSRDVTLQALVAYQRRGTGALDIHI